MKAIKKKSFWLMGIFRLVLLFVSNTANGQGKKEAVQFKPIYITAPLGAQQPKTMDEIIHARKPNNGNCSCSECRSRHTITILGCQEYWGTQGSMDPYIVVKEIPYVDQDIRDIKVQHVKPLAISMQPKDNLLKCVEMNCGAYVQPRTGQLIVAGSRPENTVYVVDGIMLSNPMPQYRSMDVSRRGK